MLSSTGVRKSRSGAAGGAAGVTAGVTAGMASGLRIQDKADKTEDILYLNLLCEDMVKDRKDEM